MFKCFNINFVMQTTSGGQTSDLHKRVAILEQENVELKKGIIL